MRFVLSFIAFSIYAVPLMADNEKTANPSLLKEHVYTIVEQTGYRNYADTMALNKTADYIHEQFNQYTNQNHVQEFYVGNIPYYNICASFGPTDAPRIIIGAHYDVCNNQAGADDNASGIAGLLELARMFATTDKTNWNIRIDLVAYSLEEPPYFATDNMGSYIHASSLYNTKAPVMGMVCIEMIGYFSDEPNSQDYPIGFLKALYGNKGNYITVTRKFGGGKFCRKFTKQFKKTDGVNTKVFTGPKWVTGLDFSDHRNYWLFGWSALMITDTAFYRNKNYHTKEDTPEKLDYLRMSSVVTKVYHAIMSMVA